jgi:two-component system nitrate/nitrite sensor histidine kinase NarX
MVTSFRELSGLFRQICERTLYAKLILLLICIAIGVILIQVGSLFILDYIPSSQATIDKITVQKAYWTGQVSYMKSIKLEDGQDILENMQNHFLDTSDPEIVWMLRQHDPIIVDAVSKVELLQVQLIQIANFNVRLTAQLRMIEKLAKAYDDLYIALQKDAEIKRSVIALLQLVSIIFVITCLIILAWHAKKLMVDRLGGLVSHIDSNYPSASFEQRRPNIDEFNQLEQRVVEMIVLIKTSEAEFGWADHVNK